MLHRILHALILNVADSSGMGTSIIPPTRQIARSILARDPNIDINELHYQIWAEMRAYRQRYYASRVDELLQTIPISERARSEVRRALLRPVTVDGVQYSNFIEEVARRMSQSIQPRSGKSAEICAELALEREGLQRDEHFAVRKSRTDLTLYHPNVHSCVKEHRVEVKNVKLRERAVRGLVFDGDTLFGFFNDPDEFTADTIAVLEEKCRQSGGAVYVPPTTLQAIEQEHGRLLGIFRENTRFGPDMSHFVKTGKIP